MTPVIARPSGRELRTSRDERDWQHPRYDAKVVMRMGPNGGACLDERLEQRVPLIPGTNCESISGSRSSHETPDENDADEAMSDRVPP